MTQSPPMSVHVTLFLIFVAIPYLPDGVLEVLDHPVFRLALIVALLASVQYSLIVAIEVLLLIGFALIQRNFRKASSIIHVQTANGPLPRMKEDADLPVSPSIQYAAPDEPADYVYSYGPRSDTGSDEFSPVGDDAAINYKQAFEPVPAGEAAGSLFANL
jgi:hypothetical protein